MIVARYVKHKKISEQQLAEITIDNERIRNIIKTVERRIQS